MDSVAQAGQPQVPLSDKILWVTSSGYGGSLRPAVTSTRGQREARAGDLAPSQRPRSPRLFTNPPPCPQLPPPTPPPEPLSVPSQCQPLPVLAACQVYLMVVAPLQPHATFAFAHLSACPRLTRHFCSARTVKIGPSPLPRCTCQSHVPTGRGRPSHCTLLLSDLLPARVVMLLLTLSTLSLSLSLP